MILIRAILAGLLVALVALAQRRFGPTPAGLLLGFPVIIGTTIVFSASLGKNPVADLAIATLFGLIPLALFLVTIFVLSRNTQLSVYSTIAVSVIVWLASSSLIYLLRQALH